MQFKVFCPCSEKQVGGSRDWPTPTTVSRLRLQSNFQLVRSQSTMASATELSFLVTSMPEPALFSLLMFLFPALPCSAQLPPRVVSDSGWWKLHWGSLCLFYDLGFPRQLCCKQYIISEVRGWALASEPGDEVPTHCSICLRNLFFSNGCVLIQRVGLPETSGVSLGWGFCSPHKLPALGSYGPWTLLDLASFSTSSIFPLPPPSCLPLLLLALF